MTTVAGTHTTNQSVVAVDELYAAHNYHPLPIAAARASGVWVTDVEGNRYLDMLSAYSALNFGHGHPDLVAAAERQLRTLTLTSRAIHNDQMGPLCADLASLTGLESALLMNSGAEAVETSLKLSRKWGYERKGVTPQEANIIVADGNFHGRTISIVSFSSDPVARGGFGPYTPGFRSVPYGDIDALQASIDANTVAILLEPIQGEAGVIIPPDGYLTAVRRLASENQVLFVADEIQSGLGRTGLTFACDHEGVVPDVYVLGKALGGGIVPLSAVVARREVMSVIRPGEHGSTFGGNPLAAAIGRAVVRLVDSGQPQAAARDLEPVFGDGLRALSGVEAVRCRGLWAAIDLPRTGPSGREIAERLLDRGVIAKDTHGHTIRFAPPLTITEEELRWAIAMIGAALAA
ncbi:MAG: ornithine--oxo-acid transaminase [Acidimicrobiia bacterium]